MRRREFLKLAALGSGALPSSPLAARVSPGQQIMTVLGPIAARRLGRTLMHEHVLVDFVGAEQIAPGRYDPKEAFQKALPHLRKVKSQGCDTLVECTPAYIGRDAELLRRLATASGLNILTNTGYYGAANDKFVPRFAYNETAEQLAARWVQEFEAGIPPAGIRPGFMKIGVDAGPLSAIDAKLVLAAALTHRQTGLAIASHTGNGIAALEQLKALQEQNVHPSAFIWVHAQNESDPSFHTRAGALGAWVEFDGISPATVSDHVDLVLRMKRAGFLRRTLVSQDAGWYNVGEPAGGNFRGYDSLFSEFLPALRKAGASQDDIQTLLVVNPRKALTPRSV